MLGRAFGTEVVPVDGGVRELDFLEGWNRNAEVSIAEGPDVDDGVALVDAVVVKPVLTVGQVVNLGPGRGGRLEQRGDDDVARRCTGLAEAA